MIEIDIPGFGLVRLGHLVSDFSGTLARDGILLEGVAEKIREISGHLAVHILTADTCGTARAEMEKLPCKIHIVSGAAIDVRKEEYVRDLGAGQVAAFGNGHNDRRMLKIARIGIAVSGTEGCSSDAIMAADAHVSHVIDAFDMLLKPNRCKATLRF